MDYKRVLNDCNIRADLYRKNDNLFDLLHEHECATAITDLLARAEAAEAQAEMLENANRVLSARITHVEALAEKAERERDAAVEELDGVSSTVGDLADFIDEQIHPIVPYNMYIELMDNVYAITMWEKESEWRSQKEK